jgi:hypothetical protein
MESIFLFVIVLAEAGIILYQNHTIRKITEDSLDRVAQKNAGIYYPKDANKHKEYEEKDEIAEIPLEDVSDDEFLKAVKKGQEEANERPNATA